MLLRVATSRFRFFEDSCSGLKVGLLPLVPRVSEVSEVSEMGSKRLQSEQVSIPLEISHNSKSTRTTIMLVNGMESKRITEGRK